METPIVVEIRNLMRGAALTAALAGGLALPSSAATFEVTGQLQADHNTVFVGSTTYQGLQNPGLSQTNQGVIYFDTSTYHFMVSENGGAYFTLQSGQLLIDSQTFTGEDTFTNSVTVQNSSVTFTGTTANVGVFINPGAPGAVEVTTAGFVGNGSALTNLNASNITSGSLGAVGQEITINLSSVSYTGQIPAQYVQFTGAAALQSGTNTFTGSDTFEGSNVFVSSVAMQGVLGMGGNRILNVGAPQALTDAVNLNSLDIATNSAVSNAVYLATSAVASAQSGQIGNSSNTFTAEQTFSNTATFGSSVTVNNVLGASSETITNTLVVGEGVTASSFTGNGAALTNITAGNLTPSGTFQQENGSALTNLNASNITSGSLGAVGQEVTINLSSVSYTGQIPAQYVQFTGAAALQSGTNTFTGSNTWEGSNVFISSVAINNVLGVAGNLNVTAGGVISGIGSGLTSLNASQLTSGTVPSAALSTAILNQSSPQAGAVYNVSSGTVSGQTLLATSSGNVGIGTSAPAHKLVVNSTSEFDVDTSNNYVSLQIGGVEVARIKP